MSSEEHPRAASPHKRPRTGRGLLMATAIALVAALVFGFVITRDDDRNRGASAGSGSIATATPPAPTTTSIDPETELVARLREILASREAAYDQRNPDLLKKIYTIDCPCLKSDSSAIRELISQDYIWVGGETSIDVRRLERVTARMWIVVADFTSEALRIETEAGRLVRAEPRGRDLFQFVLARPMGSTQWLLGRASSYEDG
jgi:hypothetical protein